MNQNILLVPTDVGKHVAQALAEDIGSGDVTASLLDDNRHCTAVLVCREAAVICGQPWVDETYASLDGAVQVEWLVDEGAEVVADTRCAQFVGPATSIMTGERTALNFLQLLSGTATKTRDFVRQLAAGGSTQLQDTRKTIPGLRTAQKYAVRCGGGVNHRMGLYDCFLIKENHIKAMGSITIAVQAARAAHPELKLEVEVENLTELREAAAAKPDIIMLDNFSHTEMQQATAEIAGTIPLEVSGGVSLDELQTIASTGVDYVSVGSLTKDVRAIDFSLKVTTTSGAY